jgi:SnoaL-like domain
MALNTNGRLAIYELITLHGHLVDEGGFNRLAELFTDDFVYDVEALGFGSLEGADAFTEASLALGDDNPFGHHVTNALVIDDEGDRATVRSKGIGILADGTSGTVVCRRVP